MDTDIQASAQHISPPPPQPANSTMPAKRDGREPLSTNEQKSKVHDNVLRRGRGGRKNKGTDMGRKAWSRQSIDKRSHTRNEADQEAKRRKVAEGDSAVPIYATQFSKEDIEADQRRPKKKVAVLMGYSGSGYHGMQLSETEKTIEGDLFPAFVAAGAISKANAMDPRKSSLVRCARTDKGVHAAGNVVSLKLIIEDPDVVKKINDNLSPQIRVWGIEVTNKSFSCYQLCDSRVYEYLIPTHCLLPPHPSTHLGKRLIEDAELHGDLQGFTKRQEEVALFWKETDNLYVKPILERLPSKTRKYVQEALCIENEVPRDMNESTLGRGAVEPELENGQSRLEKLEHTKQLDQEDEGNASQQAEFPLLSSNEAIKTIRAAYIAAKRAYRVHPDRLSRLSAALALYVGTRNFHNYTIHKTFLDSSAKRVIKSFKISQPPLVINGTEWLSLKVHGQSFMMHQIRKMVAMAVLVVRCGCDIQRITESYGNQKIPIPKAPGLGLLLERPIFDTYNKRAVADFGKNPINFCKYEKEIEEFKQREIYERIFHEEEQTNAFGNFFNHVDTLQEDAFCYLTSSGMPTTKSSLVKEAKAGNTALAEVESESDEVVDGGEEG